MFSTSTKIIVGYVVLIGLLFGAIVHTFQQMNLLAEPTDLEENVNSRRHTTHRIISQLYDAEIIGQTLRMGKLDEYSRYIEKMKGINASIDTLETMLDDTLQQARLDTVRILLKSKQWNMFKVIEAMQESPTDALYQQQLDSLIAAQDSLLNSPHIRRKVVTHHNSYTIRHKKKSFFRRLAEVFAPKEDSTLVSNVVQEEYTDTLNEVYSPVDTITNMLAGIQHRVFQTKQEQERMLNARIDRLRAASNGLSQRVNQLLETIEQDEQAAARMKLAQEREIRQKAARTMANIAIAAIVMVLLFSVVIVRDTARGNHYRRELEKAKLYAENLLAAREKLMLTITHDIKAPAGSIIGYIDLLIRLVKDRRQQFYLNNMKSSAQHLLNLVTSLLDYHRLEAGKMDIQRIAFNPNELLARICNGFLPLAEKKGLQLVLQAELPPQLVLEGDPFRIRQIIENLISNALKFTSAGKIALQANFLNGNFAFSVTDTGCGMTVQEQQRIFREFTRLQSAQGQEGFGLGLSITKKLVELLGGKISVESVPGKGSAFHVSIPLRTLPSRIAEQKDAAPEPLPRKPLRILLIDDDRIQMQLTEAALCNVLDNGQGSKPDIRCCEHPEEVLNLLQASDFDIVFTDLQMPAMNGIELLKHIRNLKNPHAKTVPVVAITARGDMSRADFHTQGFAGMLQKPFSQEELCRILKEIRPLQTAKAAAVSENPTAVSTASGRKTFNFAPLTAFSENDSQATLEIMQAFIRETKQHVRQLEQGTQEKDMKQLCAIAHKMLPTFIMIEAKDAIPALQWLEKQRGETACTPEAEKAVQQIVGQAKYAIAEAEKAAGRID